MAARKKTPDETLGLWLPKPLIEPERDSGTPVIAERRLTIVATAPETPEEEVLVEPMGDGRFIVSTLRDHGTTVAAVRYTRAQLEMLLRRIPAALEVG